MSKRRIGEMLVSEGLITPGQLREALAIQTQKGGKVVEILIASGHLKSDAFVRFLSRQGMASIDLRHYQVPQELISLVPKELAVRHEIFPIDKMGRLLTLGMACPLDSATVKHIEETTGLRVKALLCPAEDIRDAIRRYYPVGEDHFVEVQRPGAQPTGKTLRPASPPSEKREADRIDTGIKLSRISKLIHELDSLPVLPATVARVRESMSDMEISTRQVAEFITKDPPIAAKVLSVANSAAYGFPNRVDSVDLAVALLGLRETYAIVLSAAIINLFDKTKRFDYKTYWEEAMNCAAAARILAKASGKKRDAGVVTAGLLHDIGRIALLETVPELYSNVSPHLTGNDLIQAEEYAVGLTHTEAGHELALRWNIPPEIAEAIRFHHRPRDAGTAQDQVAIVYLAEAWTRRNGTTSEDAKRAIEDARPMFDVIGLTEATTKQAFEEVSSLPPVRFEWRK